MLQKALKILEGQGNISKAYQMASEGQEVVVEYRAHKRNGKPQIGLLTPAEAIQRAKRIAPEAFQTVEEAPADKVEPSKPGPTPLTRLLLGTELHNILTMEGYDSVERVAVDVDNGVLPAHLPDPGLTVDLVKALHRFEPGLVTDMALAYGEVAHEELQAIIKAELAARAEPAVLPKPVEGPDEIYAGVDPGEFHGSNGAAEKRRNWLESLVPVARFSANGRAFFRTMERGDAAEVSALTADIAVKWPATQLTVLPTVRVRWEPQYDTV